MKTVTISLFLVWVSFFAMGQVAPQKYFIEFTDKYNSPYSVTRPNEFLSLRAIERRQRQGIAIVENDLPVNQYYVNRLREYQVNVLSRSKWFNGVTVYCLNPSIIDTILRLPFVKRIFKSEFNKSLCNSNPVDKFKSEEVLVQYEDKTMNLLKSDYRSSSGFDYGPSFNQIHMLQGDSMHNLGFTGAGMVIAVLDAGFLHVDNLPAFDSLRINNQILGTKDFVNPGNNVYNEFEHGMEVLSAMGGYLPGQLIGTAPKANYWLLRSEDAHSEYLIEEYNWVSAAEFADSAGADIINSSLGYTLFDEPTQSHTCQDMNGYTTPASRGANIASGKGILVVCSAGNSGGTSWNCVSSPADAYSVLAVAAVDSNGTRAGFSSLGESTRRIKPNVAAMGSRAIVSSVSGAIMYNSGTSFSSPILAGMAACLWQAAPDWSNQSIMRAIELSGNQSARPDSLLGYGIPNFIHALQHLHADSKVVENQVLVFPNPFTHGFTVSFYSKVEQDFNLSLTNCLGQVVYSRHNQTARIGENQLSIQAEATLPDGSFILELVGKTLHLNAKVIKFSN
jgi:serine protease AprX